MESGAGFVGSGSAPFVYPGHGLRPPQFGHGRPESFGFVSIAPPSRNFPRLSITSGTMKTHGTSDYQLMLKERLLVPGGEWTPASPGWSFIHINRGAGYLMSPRLNQELTSGSVLLLSERFAGTIRSSQLTESRLHYFHVHPRRLTGILTLAEQKFLADAAANESLS